jgi:hypothetical protein
MPKQTVSEYLLKEGGFSKCSGYPDYSLMKRVHVLHYLFWSEKLNHFFIGVLNDRNKKTSAGGYKKFNTVILPKPIYTVEEAKALITSIVTE